MIHDLDHPLLQPGVIPLDLGCRVFSREGSFQRRLVVSQVYGRDPALGSSHEQPAEGTRNDGVPHSDIETATLIGGRRHAKLARRLLVKPTAGAVACLIKGHGDGPPLFEPGLEPAQTAGVGVLARRYPSDAFERSLKLIRADPQSSAKIFQ